MSGLTPEQYAIVRSLLEEKSLRKVYRESCRIRFSRENVLWATLGLIASFTFGLVCSKPSGIASFLEAFAIVALPICLGQLGFLLAGYSFFATIADKEMFFRMAETQHPQSGLSYLKHNFFVFMRVFVEYLMFSLWCVVILVICSEELGIRHRLSTLLMGCTWPSNWGIPFEPRSIVAAATLGTTIGALVYLTLQLGSFIFNIHHVVMTSIRWALETRYKTLNEAIEKAGIPKATCKDPTTEAGDDEFES